MCGTAMPITRAALSNRTSFTMLTHATPLTPLTNTNPATRPKATIIAGARSPPKARHFYDQSQASELELHIGNERHDANEGHEGSQKCAAVSHLEEIRLCLEVACGLLPKLAEGCRTR